MGWSLLTRMAIIAWPCTSTAVTSVHPTSLHRPIGSETWLLNTERIFMVKLHEFIHPCLENGLQKRKEKILNYRWQKAATLKCNSTRTKMKKVSKQGERCRVTMNLDCQVQRCGDGWFTNWIRHQTNTERQNHLPHSSPSRQFTVAL